MHLHLFDFENLSCFLGECEDPSRNRLNARELYMFELEMIFISCLLVFAPLGSSNLCNIQAPKSEISSDFQCPVPNATLNDDWLSFHTNLRQHLLVIPLIINGKKIKPLSLNWNNENLGNISHKVNH